MALLFSLLELLIAGLEQLAIGEKSLVGELGLVLEPDPAPCLVVLHCMLQHEFQHLLGFGVREFTLEDEGSDMGVQGMDNLIGEELS